MSWVRRRAQVSRICDNCDDHIRPETIYFLMATGERFCEDCPPEDDEGCSI